MENNYLSMEELNFIKGLIHHLENLDPAKSGASVVANIFDTNGETLGEVSFNGNVNSYVYYPNGQES